MNRLALSVIALALASPTVARADFLLSSGTSLAPAAATEIAPPTPASPARPSPPSSEPDPVPAPAPIHHTLRPAASPPFKTAFGFGNDIPLSFAVRQIVPPAVAVNYGPGADAATLVSWKGGDPWNVVLSAAVRPLGLRLVITWMAVEIRK